MDFKNVDDVVEFARKSPIERGIYIHTRQITP